MELFDVLKKRHSYRGEFSTEAVSRDDLTKIVEAGLIAPSGCNRQTTEFVIVDDAELVSKISSIEGANPAVKSAAAYILCVIDKDPQPVFEGLSFQVEDCAAAVENMLLAITNMGYAAVWVDGWLRRENRNEKIGKWVGLPEDKIVRILLPVGMPLEERQQPDKIPFAQRAWFNKYGE
ncbi:MAG: nitroreductase family protein [Sedimentisphaeraceae bacterium JB056]